MGAGGSTDSRSSPINANSLPDRQESASTTTLFNQSKGFENDVHSMPSGATHNHIHPPTTLERCCSHYKKNHSRLSARHSASHLSQRKFDQNSLDEGIEEIVANTLDLPNSVSDVEIPRVLRDSQNAISPIGSSRSRTGLSLSRNSVEAITDPKVPVESQVEEDKVEDDALESFPEVDFAKFKKVNNKDPPVKRNGKTPHHQDSDLLWRLGLISPEAYTHKKATRSAPSAHGEFMKPPSYDLTEEQLMANIEKEYAEYAATA